MEDELTQKEIGQYLDGLSPVILQLVTDNTWKKRVVEIAQKYSLSDDQTTILHNLVLFVLIQVEEAENLQPSIQQELGISDLLTEQVMTDLDARVFQYFVDTAEEKMKAEKENIAVGQIEKSTNTNIGTETSETPEIRPEIVPMVETIAEREVVQKTWANVDATLRQDYAEQAKPAQTTQKTQFVPDNLPGIEIENENEKPTAPTQNPEILSSSIQSATSFVPPRQDLSEAKKIAEEKPVAKSYTIDPYREPLE